MPVTAANFALPAKPKGLHDGYLVKGLQGGDIIQDFEDGLRDEGLLCQANGKRCDSLPLWWDPQQKFQHTTAQPQQACSSIHQHHRAACITFLPGIKYVDHAPVSLQQCRCIITVLHLIARGKSHENFCDLVRTKTAVCHWYTLAVFCAQEQTGCAAGLKRCMVEQHRPRRGETPAKLYDRIHHVLGNLDLYMPVLVIYITACAS